MRRALLLLLVMLLASCVQGTEEVVAADELDEIAESTGLTARGFQMTSDSFGRALAVSGAVEDDYRYSGAVAVNGRPFFEEIVVDDARYVRLLDPSLLGDVDATAEGMDALLAGEWVVDPVGAPPEFGAGALEAEDPIVDAVDPAFVARLLAPSTVLREVRATDQVPDLVNTADVVRRWNPDAADYLEATDRFPPYEEDGIRFDALPASFDPGASISDLHSLFKFFRTSAIWVKDGVITRVEQLFELPDPADPRYDAVFRRLSPASEATGPAAEVLQQQGIATIAALPDRTVSTTRTYEVTEGAVSIRAPQDATTVDLDRIIAALSGRPALPDDIGELLEGSGG